MMPLMLIRKRRFCVNGFKDRFQSVIGCGAHLLTGILLLNHDFGAISGGGQIKHLICHHFISKMDAVEILSIFPGEIVEV